MKQVTRVVLVVVFFLLVAATLTSYICLICYPDHPYVADVQKALLAESGQDDQPLVLAWAQAKGL
ncbi:MAG TPA: hypothetical protein VMT71_04770 [Syntrophorhabdales bacterium]|nr:hypothetical protein [Syntrophorhabdales bacterium]